MMLESLVLIMALGADPNAQRVEDHGVLVETSIEGQIFTWDITNLQSEPIVGFRIPHHVMYNVAAPPGWSIERTDDAIYAWTTEPQASIGRRSRKQFQAIVSTQGAVLGLVPLELNIRGQDEPVIIANVRGAVPPPAVSIYAIPIMLAGLGLLHATVTAQRTSQRN